MEGSVTEKVLVSKVPETLARLLRLTEDHVSVLPELHPEVDLLLQAEGEVFLVECKIPTTADAIAGAIERLRMAAERWPQAIPLVFVPHMGQTGQSLCERARVAWFDLSGNAHVETPRATIRILGQPNQVKKSGRQRNVFAPRSSRIVRHLLMNPGRAVTQRELAFATGLDKGFVSRVVHRLEADSLARRDGPGLLATNPALLLDAWRESYEFTRHDVHAAHRFARTGDELLNDLSRGLTAAGVRHAATGLGAAWLLSHFAGFRLVTLFVDALPKEVVLRDLGVRDEPKGANVWLVVPQDDGVFIGAKEIDGIPCASPLQVYLDLKGHPERSKEAADRLRQEFLKWENHD